MKSSVIYFIFMETKNQSKQHQISFKKFIKENKRQNLMIVDLSFCNFPSYASLNGLFESIKRKSIRTGYDFIAVVSNESVLKLARKNLPKFGRFIIEVNQNEDAINNWLTEMYYVRNYRNLLIIQNDQSLIKTTASKYNGVLNESYFMFNKIMSVRDNFSELQQEQNIIRSNLYHTDYFSEFSRTVVNPEIISESLSLFNEFRNLLGLSDVSKNEVINKINLIDIKPNSPIRESYISGKLFSVGDKVFLSEDKYKTIEYKITFLGTNYVILENDMIKLKKWIHDIYK